MKPRNETLLGCLMWSGFALIPVGLVFFLMLSFAGWARFGLSGAKDPGGILDANFALIIVVLGLAIGLGSLIFGHVKASREYRPTGQRRQIADVRVAARFAMNRQGDLLHESWQWEDDPEVDFYVKLMLPDGSIEEFKTRPEVHAAAGEGMRGTATVDGKWLGAFLPHIGAGGAPDRGDLSAPQVEVAYDPTDPRYRE